MAIGLVTHTLHSRLIFLSWISIINLLSVLEVMAIRWLCTYNPSCIHSSMSGDLKQMLNPPQYYPQDALSHCKLIDTSEISQCVIMRSSNTLLNGTSFK